MWITDMICSQLYLKRTPLLSGQKLIKDTFENYDMHCILVDILMLIIYGIEQDVLCFKLIYCYTFPYFWIPSRKYCKTWRPTFEPSSKERVILQEKHLPLNTRFYWKHCIGLLRGGSRNEISFPSKFWVGAIHSTMIGS